MNNMFLVKVVKLQGQLFKSNARDINFIIKKFYKLGKLLGTPRVS